MFFCNKTSVKLCEVNYVDTLIMLVNSGVQSVQTSCKPTYLNTSALNHKLEY